MNLPIELSLIDSHQHEVEKTNDQIDRDEDEILGFEFEPSDRIGEYAIGL